MCVVWSLGCDGFFSRCKYSVVVVGLECDCGASY